MNDDLFLTAMGIKGLSEDDNRPQDADPLAEALRIDDLRSTYCEQLEERIAQQASEIEALRRLVGLKRQCDSGRRDAARSRSVVKKIPGWLLPGLIVLFSMVFTPRSAPAQPEYTKKEHVQCIVCHKGWWTSGKYTAAGQYYMEHHTFKGYRPSKPARVSDRSASGH
jgi:hypothetical protein